ncbi:MAG: metal ABC transporter permease [Planctomycetia bacterium]|nr:metal ABC transporter permease [Planctomycetia bacterium]
MSRFRLAIRAPAAPCAAAIVFCLLLLASPLRAAGEKFAARQGELAVAAQNDAPQRHVPRRDADHHSLTDTRWQWPTWDDFVSVVSLRNVNTLWVLLGTTILGVSAGVVGVFMLLRKRSLAGDVVGHASLPGIAVAFLVCEAISPGAEKSLPALLVGAAVSGLAGVLCMAGIRRLTRIKEDAALAIVLGTFFGLGIALFTVLQSIPSGNQAGLDKFIFGNAASMLGGDLWLLAITALVVLLSCALLFKELSLVCFDEDFAAVQGWPTFLVDTVLMGLVVLVAEVGAQTVGLILVVALLIVPAAAARFWTQRVLVMTLLGAALGGLSTGLGTILSALFPNFSAGPIIVLTGGAIFAVSLVFGARRGMAWRLITLIQMRNRVGRHDLLRAFYEALEKSSARNGKPAAAAALTERSIGLDDLLVRRRWSPPRLRRLVAAARRQGLVVVDQKQLRLTEAGAAAARRAARNHRMWELFLIQHADVAPGRVDRYADQIEHVLEPDVVRELEDLLARGYPELAVPASPHALEPAGGKP